MYNSYLLMKKNKLYRTKNTFDKDDGIRCRKFICTIGDCIGVI
jgi:hypothetical protein